MNRYLKFIGKTICDKYRIVGIKPTIDGFFCIVAIQDIRGGIWVQWFESLYDVAIQCSHYEPPTSLAK